MRKHSARALWAQCCDPSKLWQLQAVSAVAYCFMNLRFKSVLIRHSHVFRIGRNTTGVSVVHHSRKRACVSVCSTWFSHRPSPQTCSCKRPLVMQPIKHAHLPRALATYSYVSNILTQHKSDSWCVLLSSEVLGFLNFLVCWRHEMKWFNHKECRYPYFINLFSNILNYIRSDQLLLEKKLGIRKLR